MCKGVLATSGTHRESLPRVGRHPQDRRTQLCDVADGHEQAGLAGVKVVHRAPYARRDHRSSAGHRFLHGQAEGLRVRRADKDVDQSQELGHIRAQAEKSHVPRQAKLGCLVAKLLLLAGAVVLIEFTNAKLRLFRVPDLLSVAFMLAMLGLVSTFLFL